MDAIQYKEFFIVVRIQRERNTRNGFQVVSQIRASPDAAQSVHSFGTFKEFVSAEVAYEFGLQQARTWIDQHTQQDGL